MNRANRLEPGRALEKQMDVFGKNPAETRESKQIFIGAPTKVCLGSVLLRRNWRTRDPERELELA
jgi:hypothetical protein